MTSFAELSVINQTHHQYKNDLQSPCYLNTQLCLAVIKREQS